MGEENKNPELYDFTIFPNGLGGKNAKELFVTLKDEGFSSAKLPSGEVCFMQANGQTIYAYNDENVSVLTGKDGQSKNGAYLTFSPDGSSVSALMTNAEKTTVFGSIKNRSAYEKIMDTIGEVTGLTNLFKTKGIEHPNTKESIAIVGKAMSEAGIACKNEKGENALPSINSSEVGRMIYKIMKTRGNDI